MTESFEDFFLSRNINAVTILTSVVLNCVYEKRSLVYTNMILDKYKMDIDKNL